MTNAELKRMKELVEKAMLLANKEANDTENKEYFRSKANGAFYALYAVNAALEGREATLEALIKDFEG